LKRVGRLDAGRRTKLRGGSQLIVRQLDQPNPSAAAPPTGEGSASPLQLVVVQNWLEELKHLVPIE